MKKFSSIWLLSLVCKLALAAAFPMTTDETYYWVWSQRPQLSYYDHPPMVAWLFWLGNFIENIVGSGLSLSRWPAVVLGHFTLVIWFFIWKILFPKNLPKFTWWFYLVLFSPLVGFGSLILTPDLPVVFFWSLSMLFFLRGLKSLATMDFVGLGAALGMGFLSKYHIVLFIPFALAFLIFEKKWSQIRFKNVLATFFTGLFFCSPVLIWNYQNQFQSFLFQLHHGFGQNNYEFFWTWSYVLAQILVLFPSVFYLALKSHLQSTQKILIYLGWGPLIFFLLSSFRGAVEVNWPIISYPAIYAMAVIAAEKRNPLLASILFWTTAFCIIGSHLLFPWIPRVPEKLSEFSQYEPVLSAQKKYSPLYAGNYQMASWVWYQTKKPFFKLNSMSRKDLFDDFSESLPSQYPIYLAMPEHTPLPEWISTDNLQMTEIEKLPNNLLIVRIDKP